MRRATLNQLQPAVPTTGRARTRRRSARLLTVSVGAVMAIGLAACSDDSGDKVAPDNNGRAVEDTATESAAPGEASGDGNGGEQGAQDDVFTVVKGDCLQLGDDLAGDITNVEKRDCGTEHDAEVYAEIEMTETTFPGPEAAAEQAQRYCAEEFEPFIGINGNESALAVNYLHPTQESWEQEDDRKIQCLVVDPEGGLTETLKDSER